MKNRVWGRTGMADKTRETRLRWFEHDRKRNYNEIGELGKEVVSQRRNVWRSLGKIHAM